MSEISSFNDVLALLDQANKQLETKIFIPSLNDAVSSKILNANHTKNLVKATLEGVFAENQFCLTIYSILNDVLDKKTDFNAFNILDKTLILLQLRAKNIKDEVDVSFWNENSEKSVVKSVSLTKHIEKYKKNVKKYNNVEVNVQVDDSQSYGFVINFPTIKEEYQFEQYLYQNRLSKVDENNVKQMKELVAPMFLNKVAPFVKQIKINDNTIDLTVHNVGERLNIIEKLPSKCLLEIINKVDEEFGQSLQNVLKVEKTIDSNPYKGDIKINAEFFIT